jgi:hypothetical protein
MVAVMTAMKAMKAMKAVKAMSATTKAMKAMKAMKAVKAMSATTKAMKTMKAMKAVKAMSATMTMKAMKATKAKDTKMTIQVDTTQLPYINIECTAEDFKRLNIWIKHKGNYSVGKLDPQGNFIWEFDIHETAKMLGYKVIKTEHDDKAKKATNA